MNDARLPTRARMLVGVGAPEHAGTVVVASDAMAHALGPSTFALWSLLLDLRDTSRTGKDHGAVYAGVPGFVRMLKARNGPSPAKNAVARALAKLKRVGLLEVLGWRPNMRGVEVYWRRAVGLLRATIGAALVPRAAVVPLADEWDLATIEGRGSRGGKRAGAGRPKGARDKMPRRDTAHLRPTIKRGDVESNGATPQQSNGARSDLSLSGSLLGTSSPSENTGEAGIDDRLSGEDPPTPTSEDWFTRPRSFVPGFVQTYRPLNRAHLVVRVPKAPLLSATDTPERHAALLRNWYVAACERLFPKDRKTTWSVKNKPTQRTRHHARFIAFAKLCVDLDVRPAAWIHYAVSQWRHMGNEKAPPVMAVFSMRKVEAECKTYDEEGRACAREQLTATAPEYIMREKWENLGIRPFPHDERTALLDVIRGEVRDAQAEVDMNVSHGKWVWG